MNILVGYGMFLLLFDAIIIQGKHVLNPFSLCLLLCMCTNSYVLNTFFRCKFFCNDTYDMYNEMYFPNKKTIPL